MNIRITSLDRHIAARIKALRLGDGAEPNVRKAAVASHMGMSYQSYGDIEAGNTAIRAEHLHKLCSFYGVPVTYFFDESPLPSINNAEEASVILSAVRAVDKRTAQEMARACLARKSAGGA